MSFATHYEVVIDGFALRWPVSWPDETSKGGTTMRATGEKPDPVGSTNRCMAGDCSDDEPISKRAPAAGLGREPKASDEVQPPTSSTPKPGEEK